MLCWELVWSGLGQREAWPGPHAALQLGGQQSVTSASVTTLFLNRRSSSSSDEHLGVSVKESCRLWNPRSLALPGGSLISRRGWGYAGEAGARG